MRKKISGMSLLPFVENLLTEHIQIACHMPSSNSVSDKPVDVKFCKITCCLLYNAQNPFATVAFMTYIIKHKNVLN